MTRARSRKGLAFAAALALAVVAAIVYWLTR
jgi:hypothetical protein